MTINLAALELQLVDQVANTTDTEELLIYSKILSKLKNQWVSVTDTLANLPDAADVEGEIYFVEEWNRIYFSNGSEWRHIDNTEIGICNTIYSWGVLSYAYTDGVFGNNSCDQGSQTPREICGGFTDWTQVAFGGYSAIGLRGDGTVWGWGRNNRGQVGNGNGGYYYIPSPVSVVGGFTDWCQVSAATYCDGSHKAAVRANGTLWSWGSNLYGELGNGFAGYGCNYSSPVSVVGGFTDWCQVSAGVSNTAAIRTNGTLWTWGRNISGKLGDGTTCYRSSPVSVVGGFTDWCQVSTAVDHTLAIRENGTLWSWGSSYFGKLGNGFGGYGCNYSSPISVLGGFTDWCQVSAGYLMSGAIRTNGTLWTWGGYNYLGRLGDGTKYDRSSPVSVVGGFTDWCQVSVGGFSTGAIRSNGTLWTWGLKFGLGTNYAGYGTLSPISVGSHNDWILVNNGNNNTLLTGIRAVITG